MSSRGSAALAAEVVVFGAGSYGQRVSAACSAAGTAVRCITDRDAERIVHGFNYRQLAAEVVQDQVVLLGVHNPGADVAAIAGALTRLGARIVLTPPQFIRALGVHGEPLSNYWLTSDSPDDVEALSARARGLLADAESVACFDRVLRYRRLGAIEDAAPEHAMSEQYLPDDIGFLTQAMRLADIGAFNGDTIRAFRARVPEQIEALFALEPDAAQYPNVVASLRAWPGLAWSAAPLAASHRAETLRFAGSAGGAAALDAAGESVVQAVPLDDLLLQWAPTHVKMDIEGAEPAALRGLEATLRAHHPRLAISAYHASDHHWSLIDWLDALGIDYRFHMRAYGQQTFDTVVYAIPN